MSNTNSFDDDNITVFYTEDTIMLQLGEQGLELTRAEAEQLFVDLGNAIKAMDSYPKAFKE